MHDVLDRARQSDVLHLVGRNLREPQRGHGRHLDIHQQLALLLGVEVAELDHHDPVCELPVQAFAADLLTHGGEPTTQIKRVCGDMSPAFIKGIKTHVSSGAQSGPGECVSTAAGHQPQIVFDRYHVVAEANDAVDTVWRAEAKTRPELKRSRYSWLNNEANLTVKQREQLTWLTRPRCN